MHNLLKAHTYSGNLKKKLLGKGVGQVVRSNLFNFLVQSYCPLSLFIYVICLFLSFLHPLFTLISFYLSIMMLTLCSSFKIVLNNCFYRRVFNWTLFFKATYSHPSCVWSHLSNILYLHKFPDLGDSHNT